MTNNPYEKQMPQTDEEYIINKHHPLERDHIRENINKFNFKIEFTETAYVVKKVGGGFTPSYRFNAVEIKSNIPFGVLSVEKDKKKQCSRIHVWSDGCCDGYNVFLINVPNGLFREIHE